MKTPTRFGCCFLVWWHLTAGVCCQPTVNPMVISPTEPINGGNATLKCTAGDFDPDLHSWVWQKGVNETYFDVTASDRILFSPVEHAFSTFYSQTLTIVDLKESDEATYLCIVVDNSTGTFINNGAGALFVNYPSEFPVCSPEGPANVSVGDSLSCRAVIGERIPDVRASDNPSGLELDWILTSVRPSDTEMGSELKKNVTPKDDGLMFLCYSISQNTNKTLSCGIGPLTVNESTTTISTTNPPAVGLSVAAIAGIAAGGSLLLLLICALCCGCNPKRCFQPKSYPLIFSGIFGTSSKQDDADRNHHQHEMGVNNLDREDATPRSPTGGQTMFSFEGSDEESNLPPPASEPNIYVDHDVPGPSTSQFVPDPSENWHEMDLKAELARALSDDEEDE